MSEKKPNTPQYPTATHASPHFTWRELGVSDPSKAPRSVIAALVRLANEVLEPTRAHFGGRPYVITSGYRPNEHQARLWAEEVKRCGSEKAAREAGRVSPPGSSLHELGMAADGKIAGVKPAELAAFHRTLPSVGGSGIYAWGAHVDIRPRRNGRPATW